MQDTELTQLLTALCSDDKTTRTNAEAMLAGNRQFAGFASRVAIAATAGANAGALPVPIRQMALTVLKQLVIDHWCNLAPEDKSKVQQCLLGALAEESSALRGLLHACAVHVRICGGAWPELQEQIGAGLVKGTTHEAFCCVECMFALLEEGGIEVAASLGALQEPLLRLASGEASPPALRRKCIEVHCAGVNTIVSSPQAPAPALEAVLSALPTWLTVHAALCTGVDGWSDRDRVECAFTAVRTITTISRFRSLWPVMADALEAVLRPTCLLVQQIDPGYAEAVIHADDGGSSEEEDNGPAQLVAQLMELIQAMLLGPQLRALLKGRARSLLQLLVPFMRVTEAQARAWREDPNEFLAQEEDDRVRGCAVRLSGEYLVGELLGHMKREAGKAIAGLAAELLERGETERAAGDTKAWKLTELALLIFGISASDLDVKSLKRSDLASLVPVAFSTCGRLCGDSGVPDLLRARAFAVLRRLGDAVCAMSPSDLPALLDAAACALTLNEPMVVRVSACRAFCRFLTAVSDKALRDRLLVERGVLASLGSLMRGADEELLHLTLESLCVIVRQCPDTIVTVASSLASLILEIWLRSRSDPLVGLQVLDLVSCATAANPQLQLALEAGLLPAVLQDLQLGSDPHAASSAVQLYGVLLKRAAVPLAGLLWQCVEPLIALIMKSEESGFLENACDSLICLVQRAPTQVTDAGLLVPMLQCVEHLLGPGLDDNACLFVGPFTTLLLSQFGKLLPAQVVTGLLRALVLRLSHAKLPYLKQELFVVVARLMHEDLAGVLGALAAMQLPRKDGTGDRNGLEFLLSMWMVDAEQIRARRARNVTVSALCRLHERCGADQQLGSLQVDGISSPTLSERLLALILAALEFENERCRKHQASLQSADLDDSEEDDDEDDDDDGDALGGASKSRTAQLLSELVDLEDDDDDLDELLGAGGGEGDTYQDLERSDPFHSMDLRRTAGEYLARQPQPHNGDLARKLAAALAEANGSATA